MCHHTVAAHTTHTVRNVDGLGHSLFLHVSAHPSVVAGTENVLKWNCAFFLASTLLTTALQSKSKPILYLDVVYCEFSLYVHKCIKST